MKAREREGRNQSQNWTVKLYTRYSDSATQIIVDSWKEYGWHRARTEKRGFVENETSKRATLIFPPRIVRDCG